ncbi:MAG TPA: NUDIX domain-containing protein [Candidatus Binatia bacterium]|nr:NUDIX domain-containing protein [Candidatus Binatia bacterium]
MKPSPHQDHPWVAVDVVIFTIDEGVLKALLVNLKEGPFRGHWAFPGGLVSLGESIDAAAIRELSEKTGLRHIYLEQLCTFGDPHRDPRAHVVSVAYFALLPRADRRLAEHPKYARLEWRAVTALPPLAYDHNRIAAYALDRLRAKLAYTNIVYSLLPDEFTLGELQEIYEMILGTTLDRRNFRKKLLAAGLLRALPRVRRGPHRPATLYAFAQRRPMNIPIL